jgi:hypothetical protein
MPWSEASAARADASAPCDLDLFNTSPGLNQPKSAFNARLLLPFKLEPLSSLQPLLFRFLSVQLLALFIDPRLCIAGIAAHPVRTRYFSRGPCHIRLLQMTNDFRVDANASTWSRSASQLCAYRINLLILDNIVANISTQCAHSFFTTISWLCHFLPLALPRILKIRLHYSLKQPRFISIFGIDGGMHF